MAETPINPEPQDNGPDPLTPPATPEPASPDLAGATWELPTTTAPSETMASEPVVQEPEPPQPAPPAAAAPAEEPSIAATLNIAPLEGAATAAAEGGGEFELLLQKIRDWLGSGELQAQWQRFRGPLKGVAILIGAILMLRVYGALVGTIDGQPLVGGLLELVGLIAVTRFSLTRLVRKSDREQVIAEWSKRWNDFRGKD
jgi:hypothetical protein